MAVIFEQSAYRHFTEDRLNEKEIRKSMQRPVWFTLVDPDNTELEPPVTNVHPKTALLICKRRPGALNDDLIEILVHPDGRHMKVFHVEHLGPKWRSYWEHWR